MSFKDYILDYLEETYSSRNISDELAIEIAQLEESIESLFEIDHIEPIKNENPIDFYGDMDMFSDEEY
jgi:hypothetical protein